MKKSTDIILAQKAVQLLCDQRSMAKRVTSTATQSGKSHDCIKLIMTVISLLSQRLSTVFEMRYA